MNAMSQILFYNLMSRLLEYSLILYEFQFYVSNFYTYKNSFKNGHSEMDTQYTN